MYWLDLMGVLAEPASQVAELEASKRTAVAAAHRPRRPPSLDLGTLAGRGVDIAGRLSGIDGYRLRFGDDLVKTTAAADAKLALLLHRIDSIHRAQPAMAHLPPSQSRPSGRSSSRPRRRSICSARASAPWCGQPASAAPTHG